MHRGEMINRPDPQENSIVKWVIVVLTLALATWVVVKLAEDIDSKSPEPSSSASVVASLGGEGKIHTQQSILESLPPHCKMQGAPIGADCVELVPPDMRGAVSCPNEDGTGVKGQLCLWQDPRDFKIYFVVSD